jgi:hypothetical protein
MITLLTSRVDADHSNVKSTELGRQEFNEMICRSFACGVAGQIHVRRIMHTGARACHDNSTTADISAQKSIAEINL